jgi:hypothetical protein
LKGFLCIYKQKELYINNLIELNINPVYTINIIITYRRKIAKHDTIHMHEPRSLEPLAQRRNKKKLFAALLLEPHFSVKLWGLVLFLFGGFAFRDLGLFGAPRCLDPALKQETKNPFRVF